VLVVPIGDPKAKILQVDPGVAVWRRTLFWKPDSGGLGVSDEGSPSFYSVPTGKLWKSGKPDPSLSRLEGFIDSEHALARQKPADLMDWIKKPITLHMFELPGRIAESSNRGLRLAAGQLTMSARTNTPSP
jgi:hypothetical protein